MNNLEYIRSLEVGKLAEFITDCSYSCYVKGYFVDDCIDCPLIECAPCTEDSVAKWLLEERRTDEKDTDSVCENL